MSKALRRSRGVARGAALAGASEATPKTPLPRCSPWYLVYSDARLYIRIICACRCMRTIRTLIGLAAAAGAAAVGPLLVASVADATVWSALDGVAPGAWVPTATSPFTLSQAPNATITLMATGATGVSCFQDMRLVPLLATPPAALVAAYVWTGDITMGGVPANVLAAPVANALAAFLGLPPSSVTLTGASYANGVATAHFTVVATLPEQRAAVLVALTARQSPSTSSSSDTPATTTWPAPNLGPALATFIRTRTGNTAITFVDLSSVVEKFVPRAGAPPPLLPPAPMYPAAPGKPPHTIDLGHHRGGGASPPPHPPTPAEGSTHGPSPWVPWKYGLCP